VETEERDERGSGRSQNVVHTLPRSMASVPHFLAGPLERIDPAAGTTQVLVITADAETAVALAEAVLTMTGPAGIELLPITTARRAKRLMSGRPVLAAAGSPRDIRTLLQGSDLKLDSVKAVVIAWADEILSSGEDEVAALELVMNELPKDAARIVVTSRSEGRVNAFAERYLRRARREATDDVDENAQPVAIQYVTVSAGSRATAFRRLLDDMDPPSAAIIVSNDSSEREVTALLRTLGYSGSASTVRVSRGEIEPSTYAVIFFDAPATQAQLAQAAQATPVALVALTDIRELAALKRLTAGTVKPFALTSPGDAARAREAAMRSELATILDSGVASREVLALEPLLERHDGIEIAAAALRLLEKERVLRSAAQETRAVPETPRGSFERKPFAGRPKFGGPRDREERRPREGGREAGREGRREGAREGGRDDRRPREGRRDQGPPRRPSGRGDGRPPRRDRP
jgi:ATP-dependent RNA helicase DeaD